MCSSSSIRQNEQKPTAAPLVFACDVAIRASRDARSSARYISRVHGLVNDACSMRETSSMSSEPASGSMLTAITLHHGGESLLGRARPRRRDGGHTAAGCRLRRSCRRARPRHDGHPADRAGERRRRNASRNSASPAHRGRRSAANAEPFVSVGPARERRRGIADGRPLELDEPIGLVHRCRRQRDTAQRRRRRGVRRSTRRRRRRRDESRLPSCASASSADTATTGRCRTNARP